LLAGGPNGGWPETSRQHANIAYKMRLGRNEKSGKFRQQRRPSASAEMGFNSFLTTGWQDPDDDEIAEMGKTVPFSSAMPAALIGENSRIRCTASATLRNLVRRVDGRPAREPP
jgi:hypothetical protein